MSAQLCAEYLHSSVQSVCTTLCRVLAQLCAECLHKSVQTSILGQQREPLACRGDPHFLVASIVGLWPIGHVGITQCADAYGDGAGGLPAGEVVELRVSAAFAIDEALAEGILPHRPVELLASYLQQFLVVEVASHHGGGFAQGEVDGGCFLYPMQFAICLSKI